MKTIYIDSDFMCHLENAEGRTPIGTDVFDGIVDAAIPYYRYIPQGEEWADPKTGRVLHGLFIQATDTNAIDLIIQQAFFADMQNALSILGVNA